MESSASKLLHLISSNTSFTKKYIQKGKTNKQIREKLDLVQKSVEFYNAFSNKCTLCKTCGPHVEYSHEFVKRILSLGWSPLSKKSTSCEHILRLINSIRQLAIDFFYYEYHSKTNFRNVHKTLYIAPGSKDITSDYDLTLIGPETINVTEHIYNGLKGIVENISYSMDSNLYFCFGFNQHIPFFRNVYKHLYKRSLENMSPVLKLKNKDVFTFQPTNNKTFLLCTFLLHNKFNVSKVKNESFKKLINLFYPPKFMIQRFEYILNHFGLEMDAMYINCNTTTTNQIDRCYQESFRCGKILFNLLNNKTFYKNYLNDKKYEYVVFILCIFIMKHSIEGYHTPCSMNVVVYELQMKNDFGKELNIYNYFVAFIENIIDLLVHTNNGRSGMDVKEIVKHSKYMYRIDHCMQMMKRKIGMKQTEKYKNVHRDIKQLFRLRGGNSVKEQERFIQKLSKHLSPSSSKQGFKYSDYIQYVCTHAVIEKTVTYISDQVST